ncbi:imidazolonepropionase [Mytilus galloprovincialis]|uniref:Imidazolonepropionase n=1 Tax=Mytilus galloprovincialis TaxID=29158 RepID=A0A8B6HA19_MYTGA|nr:imidazolonepropionase [Mytilus galloprovincialis]
MSQYKLLVRSAKQVVTVRNDGAKVVCGKDMQAVDIIDGDDNDGVNILISKSGKIEFVGKKSKFEEKYKNLTVDVEIDATGKCVIPGLVDAHTHPVWAGDRVHEFAMKMTCYFFQKLKQIELIIKFGNNDIKKISLENLYPLVPVLNRLYSLLSTHQHVRLEYHGNKQLCTTLMLHTRKRMLQYVDLAMEKNNKDVVHGLGDIFLRQKVPTAKNSSDIVKHTSFPYCNIQLKDRLEHTRNIDLKKFIYRSMFNLLWFIEVVDIVKSQIYIDVTHENFDVASLYQLQKHKPSTLIKSISMKTL